MGSAGWCLNRTNALNSAWGTSGLTNHGLTYLAIMSCLLEQSGEGVKGGLDWGRVPMCRQPHNHAGRIAGWPVTPRRFGHFC